MSNGSSMIELYNARDLSPEEVASSFVPPPFMRKLMRRGNTIIVGPRGSGKTTLLKMLQQRALENWTHERADELIEMVDYSTVFVPVDTLWTLQLNGLGEGKLDVDTLNRFKKTAFVLHSMNCWIDAVLDRLAPEKESERILRRIKLTKKAEVQVVNDIAKAWKIEPSIYSFKGLKNALDRAIIDLSTFASKCGMVSQEQRAGILLNNDIFHLSLLQCIIFATKRLDNELGDLNSKWALLYDELELAPIEIHEEIMTAVRASSPKLIFKLALSPAYDQLSYYSSSLEQASPVHDFEPIRLWYVERYDGKEFSELLWTGLVRDKLWKNKDALHVLGSNYQLKLDYDENEIQSQSTRIRRTLMEGYKHDSGFRNYIGKNLDVDKLISQKGDDRRASLGKILPLLDMRLFYRREGSDSLQAGAKLRRVVPSYYTGADALFAITEGNPRWFKALFTPLLEKYDSQTGTIRREAQVKQIELFALRHQALLRTRVVNTQSPVYNGMGVYGLIRIIADYIFNKNVLGRFNIDPPTYIVINREPDKDLKKLLIEAINIGALVYMPEDNSNAELIVNQLKKKRFRISYTLAPLMKIPIRIVKPVSLYEILNEHFTGKPSKLVQKGQWKIKFPNK
jgi:energy-coupling factor transporter ATP-binding protein EcfA2